MTALADFLFPAHAGRSTVAIIAWWEARRLPYNLLVGGAGLLSLVLTSLLAALPPFGGDVPFMWAPIVAFGIMANVCYLIGPVARRLHHADVEGRGAPHGARAIPSGADVLRRTRALSDADHADRLDRADRQRSAIAELLMPWPEGATASANRDDLAALRPDGYPPYRRL